MQTLYVLLYAMRKVAKRNLTTVITVFMCISLMPSLGACGTLQNIHVDRSTNSTAPENTCAKAYKIAKNNQRMLEKNDGNQNGTNQNNVDWKTAAKAWETVAQQCPGRLSESIVYTAKAQWEILNQNNSPEASDKNSITQQIEHNAYVQMREVLDHYKNFQWTHNPLAQAAASEDQLSFILQALAAKKIPGLPLEYSDIASTNAQGIMRAAGKGTDLRKKVYEIPQQALDSGIIHDSTSKKDLPLAAFAYMNCARGELAAFQQTITINAINQNRTNANNDVSASSNKNSANANNARGKNSDDNNAVLANQAFKNAIVKLITSRLLRAYALGYPADVSLLFSK